MHWPNNSRTLLSIALHEAGIDEKAQVAFGYEMKNLLYYAKPFHWKLAAGNLSVHPQLKVWYSFLNRFSTPISSGIWIQRSQGLPSGKVLDLRTGYVRAACQDERISLRLGANPDFAEPKLWIRTLNETLPPDCIEWFQRWCGYCLTGYTREHQFVFAFGAGRNGKSTVLGTIEKLLGGYCRGLPATALAGGRHEQHPEWLARIEGARLVSALELSENASWRLALLKALVAGDMMTAHHMRKGSFDFQPVCKLVVAGNHKPNLSSVDKAIESRLVLLPFERTSEGNRVNQKLPEMLRAELPRILGWAVEGAMKFFRDGLGSKPVTANTASVEYLAEQNIFSEWVAERLEFISEVFVSNRQLLKDYNEYASANLNKSTPITEYLMQHEGVETKRDRLPGGKNPVHGLKGIRLAI